MEVRHIEEENLRPIRKTFINLNVGDIVLRDWYVNDCYSKINGATYLKGLLLPDVGIVQSRSTVSGKIKIIVKFLSYKNQRTNEVTFYLFNKNSTVSAKRIDSYGGERIYSDINEFLECRFKHIKYLNGIFKTYLSHLDQYRKSDDLLDIYFKEMALWNGKLRQWFYKTKRLKN